MVQRLALGVVAFLCATSTIGYADGPALTAPQPPAIAQFVDIATKDMIAGWAVDWRTGAQPNHLDVLDIQFDPLTCPGITCTVTRNAWIEVNMWGNVARPDVARALVVGGFTGYGLTFREPLLPGRHFVSLFWNEYLTNTSHSVTVLIDVP